MRHDGTETLRQSHVRFGFLRCLRAAGASVPRQPWIRVLCAWWSLGPIGLPAVGDVAAQQRSDSAFAPSVADPAYARGTGPVILLDEAHVNFHTRDGRYRAFADVLEADGYQVRASAEPFTAAVLREARVLAIANALHESNATEWRLPTPSAFTDAEIGAVVRWVREGGSLLLIADHMPFPGAASDLARAFGFEFTNGFAMSRGGTLVFRRSDGTLANHAITNGRGIDSVATFTGQAFQASDDVVPLLILPPGIVSLEPDVAWEFNETTARRDVGGHLQGAVRAFGAGRVAVFGEAAMFSAQRTGTGVPMGMNAPIATQNPEFLRAVLAWLVTDSEP